MAAYTKHIKLDYIDCILYYLGYRTSFENHAPLKHRSRYMMGDNRKQVLCDRATSWQLQPKDPHSCHSDTADRSCRSAVQLTSPASDDWYNYKSKAVAPYGTALNRHCSYTDGVHSLCARQWNDNCAGRRLPIASADHSQCFWEKSVGYVQSYRWTLNI